MGALKRRLTRQQLMDGGSIAEARASVKVQGGRLTIHYGTSMIDDPRLSALLDREAKFLNVLIARKADIFVMLCAVSSYFTTTRILTIGSLCVLYATVALHCASIATAEAFEASFCAVPASGGSGDSFAVFRPGLVNSLAALLLSFYANQVIQEYKAAYLASQRMKQQVVLLLTLAAAEMGDLPGGTAVLLELWRCKLRATLPQASNAML